MSVNNIMEGIKLGMDSVTRARLARQREYEFDVTANQFDRKMKRNAYEFDTTHAEKVRQFDRAAAQTDTQLQQGQQRIDQADRRLKIAEDIHKREGDLYKGQQIGRQMQAAIEMGDWATFARLSNSRPEGERNTDSNIIVAAASDGARGSEAADRKGVMHNSAAVNQNGKMMLGNMDDPNNPSLQTAHLPDSPEAQSGQAVPAEVDPAVFSFSQLALHNARYPDEEVTSFLKSKQAQKIIMEMAASAPEGSPEANMIKNIEMLITDLEAMDREQPEVTKTTEPSLADSPETPDPFTQRKTDEKFNEQVRMYRGGLNSVTSGDPITGLQTYQGGLGDPRTKMGTTGDTIYSDEEEAYTNIQKLITTDKNRAQGFLEDHIGRIEGDMARMREKQDGLRTSSGEFKRLDKLYQKKKDALAKAKELQKRNYSDEPAQVNKKQLAKDIDMDKPLTEFTAVELKAMTPEQRGQVIAGLQDLKKEYTDLNLANSKKYNKLAAQHYELARLQGKVLTAEEVQSIVDTGFPNKIGMMNAIANQARAAAQRDSLSLRQSKQFRDYQQNQAKAADGVLEMYLKEKNPDDFGYRENYSAYRAAASWLSKIPDRNPAMAHAAWKAAETMSYAAKGNQFNFDDSVALMMFNTAGLFTPDAESHTDAGTPVFSNDTMQQFGQLSSILHTYHDRMGGGDYQSFIGSIAEEVYQNTGPNSVPRDVLFEVLRERGIDVSAVQ